METFSKNSNTQVSKLNLNELKAFKDELSSFYIPYRESLDFSEQVQFGLEVEYDKLEKCLVDEFLVFHNIPWFSYPELSLEEGGEITSPILYDRPYNWSKLKEVCEFLRLCLAQDNEKTGAHIHVGADILGNDMSSWDNLIKMIIAYENIFFRYSSGEQTILRDGYIKFAYPIALEVYERYFLKYEPVYLGNLKDILGVEKYQGFNFKNIEDFDLEDKKGKNTIEFRYPNGTFEEIIWQNNVNTFVKFLLACKKELDMDYIDYRIRETANHFNHGYYKFIDEEGALHLADQIFDNDFDKACFLRQYYKDFSHIDDNTEFKNTKTFIKH